MNKILILGMAIIAMVGGASFGMILPMDSSAPIQSNHGLAILPTYVTPTNTLLPTATPTVIQVAQVDLVYDTPTDSYIPPEVVSYNETVEQVAENFVIPTLPAVTAYNTEIPTEQIPTIEFSDVDDAFDSIATPQIQIQLKQPQCVFPLQRPYVLWGTALGLAFKETPRGQSDGELIELKSQDIAVAASAGGAIFPYDGIVSVREDIVWDKLTTMRDNGEISGCYDTNGGANAYGPGVQAFLDWLVQFVIYE